MPNATARRASALGRTAAVIGAAGLVAVALSACSTNPNNDCGSALSSGKASQLVEATGKIGSRPKVTVPTPVDATKSQRSLLTESSDSTLVHKGQQVEVGFTVIDAATGSVLGSGYGDQGAVVPVGTDVISRGLICAPVGSRVAIVVAPKDAPQQADSAPGTQIYVLDVLKTSLNAANGAVRPAASGFPTVVLAPTGQPGLTIPSSGSAPTKVRSELLKQGDGPAVKKDSTAVLQYTAVGWDSKQVLTSSWTDGGPDRVDMASGQSQIQNQNSSVLPQAMLKELVGQKVGSQLVIETPTQGQFPAAAWVVDILGIH
ncbi:peptidylprolyl isomerase [Leifsonia sp. NPDC014704]|uniref:peptidylprolyl isomerase n=1 Tax=Leifsonia sp. NPDC014704 TaxID=3364123 RepID=UPI0036F4884F